MHDERIVVGPNENGYSIMIDNAGIYFMKYEDDIAVFFVKIVSWS